MQKSKFKPWLNKYEAKSAKGKFWSEVYGQFTPISDVMGFCPVCEEPLIDRDVDRGRCGYCGALFNNNFKREVDFDE